MSLSLIKDYLQTQGLRLSLEDVRMAHLASQAVVDLGQAEIEHALLWPSEKNGFVLAEYITRTDETEQALKQVFMALDAACSRMAVQSAAVYVRPSEQAVLVCAAQQGLSKNRLLSLEEDEIGLALAVRSAQTGWLNVVNDVPKWQALEGLPVKSECFGSAMSLPVCLSDGRVVGVLSVESADASAFNEEAQAIWVGLALALVAPLTVLSAVKENTDE